VNWQKSADQFVKYIVEKTPYKSIGYVSH
jgi:hypothetical protein